MAGDVIHKISGSATGKEGVAIINPNSLKIPIDYRYLQNEVPLTPINDVWMSGRYMYRFDDVKYYTT